MKPIARADARGVHLAQRVGEVRVPVAHADVDRQRLARVAQARFEPVGLARVMAVIGDTPPKQLVVMRHFLHAFGRHAAAAQHVGEEGADVVETLGPPKETTRRRRTLAAHPVGEVTQPVGKRRRRLVAEQTPRLVDVRPRLRHVARLFGLPVDHGRDPQHALELAHQLHQAHGVVVPEVDDLERRAVVAHRGAKTGHDVADVGVVAARRAVAEERDRLAGEHQLRELC
jgi:hypothetical protein